jgi:hypothetical protein
MCVHLRNEYIGYKKIKKAIKLILNLQKIFLKAFVEKLFFAVKLAIRGMFTCPLVSHSCSLTRLPSIRIVVVLKAGKSGMRGGQCYSYVNTLDKNFRQFWLKMQQLAYKNEANLNTFATNVGDFLKKSMLR